MEMAIKSFHIYNAIIVKTMDMQRVDVKQTSACDIENLNLVTNGPDVPEEIKGRIGCPGMNQRARRQSAIAAMK